MRAPGKWSTSYNPYFPSIQNIEPVDDVCAHKWGTLCECKPQKQEQFIPGRGVVAVQIVHNAYDGRE